MLVPLILILAQGPSARDIDRALRIRLAAGLRGMPIHGERFRAKVTEIGAVFKQDNVDFVSPAGKPDSTVFCFSVGPAYVAYRRSGRLLVEPLQIPADYGEDGYLYGRVLQAGWSKGRLFALFRWQWVSGDCDFGRVFELRHGQWRMVQHLDARGENADDGDHTYWKILSGRRLEIQSTFVIRRWIDEERSHSEVELNYREQWRFKNGRLSRTSYRRIQTPFATLCDLCREAEHRQRAKFNESVAPELRDKVWRTLANGHHSANGDGGTEPRDATTDLLLDREIGVKFSRRHGRWVLSSFG